MLVLPIESVLPDALSELKNRNLVLLAPPGAGKSTRLPLAILENWLGAGKRIVMLQPRRVVVRALARYLASQLGEEVGQSVGYQVRGERKMGKNTRLEIVTEGVLTRRIQSDPELENIDLLIFDEFHERSLNADFGLALAIEVQASLRPDLRLLVMSATLEGAHVSSLIPDASQLEVEGRSFPIDYRYAPFKPHQIQVDHIVSTIKQALTEQKGSILVFLAGTSDIRQVAEKLEDGLPENTKLYALYGELDKRAQMEAIAPSKEGERKVVLATNIAETSLTIEGINTVVDAGFEKVAYFDPKKGLTRLKTQAISMSSATQRAGRAGRLGPGVCYRLWSEELSHRKAKQSIPAIMREDITGMMLDAAVWGSEMSALPLLDQPSNSQQRAAQELLVTLGALDGTGKATSHGRNIAEFGNHPRLASLLISAEALSSTHAKCACLLAALLEEARQQTVDISQAMNAMMQSQHRPIFQQAIRLAKRLKVNLNGLNPGDMSDVLPELLLLAFPDRIARHRSEGRYLLANGSGGWLPEQDTLTRSEWLVVADLQLGERADARITSALQIDYADIEKHCQANISQQVKCDWQTKDGDKYLRCKQQLGLGAIVLSATSIPGDSVQQQASDAWQQEIQRLGWDALPLSNSAQSLITRISQAKQLTPELDWPDVTPGALMESTSEWLIPMLSGKRKWSDLQTLDWLSLIKNKLDWSAQQQLEKSLPVKFTAPTGTSVNIEYREDGSAYAAIKLTEMYGLSVHPTVANGRLPLTFSLLSPAMRPVQTTRDIVSFWQGSYRDVQKDMKARYPKHFWPDDPANATPTKRTKNAMR